MSGSAVLGSSLVDGLLGMVDDLRGGLNSSMGTRQHRVYTERRTWSGARRYEGTCTTVKTELLPAPLFVSQVSDHLRPEGHVEVGDAQLRELSLTYTEAQITGGSLGESVEWYIVVEDGLGQGIDRRYFQVDGAPRADREKSIGWIVNLHRVQSPAT